MSSRNGNGHVPDDAASSTLANAPPVFSPREEQIVDLIAQGRSNREIGLALGISYLTVKIHVRHIYAKMGVDNRIAAVLWTAQHGQNVTPALAGGAREIQNPKVQVHTCPGGQCQGNPV